MKKQQSALRQVAGTFQEIEEMLMAGLVPSPNQWSSLHGLPHPWRGLSIESLEGLRASGGALLPTLRRLRQLAENQNQTLNAAQAKSSQAFAQAFACSMLVPILGLSLYFLLPAVQQSFQGWAFANLFALILSAVGAIWLVQMTDRARWGGIREENRPWILGAQCAGERFLARVRSGSPPDLAWAETCQLLSKEAPQLAVAWGHSIWDEPQTNKSAGPTEQSLISAGTSMRKAVHLSLMEGRPCIERVETALFALRAELTAHVDRELSMLATRALKPLFIFVAPGLVGLLVYGLWLVLVETTGGDFNAL